VIRHDLADIAVLAISAANLVGRSDHSSLHRGCSSLQNRLPSPRKQRSERGLSIATSYARRTDRSGLSDRSGKTGRSREEVLRKASSHRGFASMDVTIRRLYRDKADHLRILPVDPSNSFAYASGLTPQGC
jgi:hypothetical protein